MDDVVKIHRIRLRQPSRRSAIIAAALITLLLPVFLTGVSVKAQGTLNIAAIVNDDVISAFDLGQRIQLTITQTNLPNNPQTQQRIAGSVLRRLINEKLHVQEARRLGIDISDESIQAVIGRLETRANIPPGGMPQFLERRGIDPDVLVEKVRAEESWKGVVAVLFRNLVTVSDVEVEDIIEDANARKGKTEYLIAEIFLAYDDRAQADVRQSADQLIAQLRGGATWVQIAQNFSDAVSASRGGLLDWQLSEDFHPDVALALSELDTSQVSQPVPTQDGIYIVTLRGKREAPGIVGTAPDPTVRLQQLHLPIPPGTDAATASETVASAQNLAASAQSCEAFAQISSERGSPLSGELGEFKTSQLSPTMRETVATLPINTPSNPVRTADGVIVLMVCARTGVVEDPLAEARSRIRTQLLNERLGRFALQHEQKLRREAFIDLRI